MKKGFILLVLIIILSAPAASSSFFDYLFSSMSDSLTGSTALSMNKAELDLYDVNENNRLVGTANPASQGKARSISPKHLMKISLTDVIFNSQINTGATAVIEVGEGSDAFGIFLSEPRDSIILSNNVNKIGSGTKQSIRLGTNSFHNTIRLNTAPSISFSIGTVLDNTVNSNTCTITTQCNYP